MIANYLKIAWRNIYKHRFYSLINVFGLGMSIACALLLFLFISYHISFDTYHANAKRIYRVVTELRPGDGSVMYDQGSPPVLGQMLKQQNPSVLKEAVLLKKRSFVVTASPNDSAGEKIFNEKENIAFADNALFAIFNYQWIAGNTGTALSRPNTAVITTTLAKKYFNSEDVLGKVIRLDDKYNITITGLLGDERANTDVRADMYISLSSVKGMYPDAEKSIFNQWGSVSSKTNVFVLLAEGASANAVNRNIRSLTKTALTTEANAWQFHLQPLAEVHFDARYSGTIAKPLLMILALIGLALLLIAGVNFVNMAMAQSITRAKEIGTRKVLGGSRAGIFWQFITETAYVALAATVLALLAVWSVLPVFNNWLQLPLVLNTGVFIFLMPMLVVLIFAAGFYPAVILSGFKPVNALKNNLNQSTQVSRFSRGGLIVIQNVIAQLLIVCTLIITLQVNFLKNADMGFNKNAIIMVPLPAGQPNTLTFLRNQLSNLPGIKNLTYCYSAPADLTNKGGSVKYAGRNWENFNVNSIIGDANYLQTFGLKLVAGRNISATDTSAQYLVNQQLLKKLNIRSSDEAIGQQLTAGDFNDKRGTIVGVLKDFNTHPLYSAVEPTLIAAQPLYYRYAAVKVSGNNTLNVIADIKGAWQKAYPQNVFEYRFLDQQIADFYQKEEMISKLITAGASIAIAISCLGLLGLISLITVQRTKEIGIRKVLGASVSTIVGLLTRDFIKLVAIAIVISTPIALWMMHSWLQNFAYRITMQWWVFLVSGLAAVFIACLTVSIRAVKAAMCNPVDSLRDN